MGLFNRDRTHAGLVALADGDIGRLLNLALIGHLAVNLRCGPGGGKTKHHR
jgi:hypothetical protein